MSKRTKTQAVLDHLRSNDSITSMEAFELYGATRLGVIIYQLRHRGLNISNEWVEGTDRYGSPMRYVRYRLEPEE